MKRNYLLLFTICIVIAHFPACRKKEEKPVAPVVSVPPTKDSIDFGYNGSMFSTDNVIFYTGFAYKKTFNWDFGDGTSSSENDTLLHVYDKAGTYTVKLTIGDVTTQKNVTISDEWKKIKNIRTWDKWYHKVIDWRTQDILTVHRADTQFALQVVDFNRIILHKEPDYHDYKDTMMLYRVWEQTPSTIKDVIVYRNQYVSPRAALEWHYKKDSISIIRTSIYSGDTVLTYCTK